MGSKAASGALKAMKPSFPLLVLALLASLGLTGRSWAQDAATPEQAKAMALAAEEFLEKSGPETAFAEFSSPDGRFRDGELYVFVVDAEGVTRAHGADPSQIGRNVLGVTDIDGVPFIRRMLAIKEEGWVDYKYVNPVTKRVQPKSAYVVHRGDYWIGVGAYR